MSELKSKIRSDLTASMKAKDTATVSTLRMLLSAIQMEEVAGAAARELSDAEVLKVLARESKKRGEAAALFADAGRAELAAKERSEAVVIARYLPAQLGDEELAGLVDQALAQVAAELGSPAGPRQMGQVMKAANALVAGRAEGARVSALVKAKLAAAG